MTPSSMDSINKHRRDRRRKSRLKRWTKLPRLPAVRREFTILPTRKTLTYAEAQKFVDVLSDGQVHRLNVSDSIEIETSRDVIEAIEREQDESEHVKADPPLASDRLDLLCKCVELDGHDSQTKRSGAFVLTPAYLRCFEKTHEELDEEVEYDVDEEDIAWLRLLNDYRKSNKLPPVSLDDLEFALDRLEKEAHALTTLAPLDSERGQSKAHAPAEGSAEGRKACCVCRESSASATNAVLSCSSCELAVHQDCYGVPYQPDGQWLCKKCLKSPNSPVKCCLCPCPWRDKDGPGAMKQTTDGRWVHIVCALFIPEVSFGSNVYLEPVERMDKVPKWRHDTKCHGCNKAGRGACLGCQAPSCTSSFHALCAIKKGCYVKLLGSSPNSSDFDSSKPFSSKRTGDRRTRIFFCPAHAHLSSREGEPRLERSVPDGENLHRTMESEQNFSMVSLPDIESQTPLNKLSTKKPKPGKRPRKSSQLNGSVVPGSNSTFHLKVPIEVPKLSQECLVNVANHLTVRDRQQLMMRIHRYWLLKRHSRQGFPLIQRLQQVLLIHHILKMKSSSTGLPPLDKESMQSLKKLRRDYEKVRLLLELIRKRERLKVEMLKIKEDVVELTLQPFCRLLRHTLRQLQSRDANGLFAQPVTEEEAPGYRDVIKHPMDYSTMATKIDDHLYTSMDDFQRDFDLVIRNCLEFNGTESPLYKIAVKHDKQCSVILKAARRMCERADYCPTTGLHFGTVQSQVKDAGDARALENGSGEGVNTADILQTPQADESMELSRKLEELHWRLDVLHVVKARGSFQRVKQLKKEICLTKRKMTLMQRSHKKAAPPNLVPPLSPASGDPGIVQKERPVSRRRRVCRALEEEFNSDSTIPGKLSPCDDGASLSKQPRLSSDATEEALPAPLPYPAVSIAQPPSMGGERNEPPELQPAKFRPVSRRNRMNGGSILLNPNGKLPGLHSTPVNIAKIKATNSLLSAKLSLISPIREESNLSQVADENKEPLAVDRALLGPCHMRLRSCMSARVTKASQSIIRRCRKQLTTKVQSLSRKDSESGDRPPAVSPEKEENPAGDLAASTVEAKLKRGAAKVARRIPRIIRVKSSQLKVAKRSESPREEVKPFDAVECPGDCETPQRERVRRLTRSSVFQSQVSILPSKVRVKSTTAIHKLIKSSFIEKSHNLSPEDEKMLTTFPVVLMEKSPEAKARQSAEEIDSSYESLYSLDTVENSMIRKEPTEVQAASSANESRASEVSQNSAASKDQSNSSCRQVLHELDSEDANASGKNSQASSSDCSKDARDLETPMSLGDVVWAKTKGYPWYPAMIMTSDVLPTEEPLIYHQNLVPPEAVMALRSKFTIPLHLVRFFDRRRNWQWLPRCKLDTIGVDHAMDKERINSVRPSNIRRDVKRAYDAALLHRRATLKKSEGSPFKITPIKRGRKSRRRSIAHANPDPGQDSSYSNPNSASPNRASGWGPDTITDSNVGASDASPKTSFQVPQHQGHPLNCSQQFLSSSSSLQLEKQEEELGPNLQLVISKQQQILSCSL